MYLTLGIVRALPRSAVLYILLLYTTTCTVAFEKLTASESNPINPSEEAEAQPEKIP